MGGRGSGFGRNSSNDGNQVGPSGPIVVVEAAGIKKALNANSKSKEAGIDYFVEYLNQSNADDGTRKLYNNINKIKNDILDVNNINLEVKYTNAKTANYYVEIIPPIGKTKELVVVIPRLENSNFNRKIVTTAHELAHFIDISLGNLSGELYSSNHKLLNDAINTHFLGHSNEVQKVFDRRKDMSDKLYNEARSAINTKTSKLRADYEKKFGIPSTWNIETRRNYNNESNDIYNVENGRYLTKLNKNKLINNGAALEDIYDALSNGRYKDRGIVRAGHGSRYYTGDPKLKNAEIFANYLHLSIENQDLIEVLRRDKPDLVKALEIMKSEMLGELENEK